jgi:hypothetical protein
LIVFRIERVARAIYDLQAGLVPNANEFVGYCVTFQMSGVDRSLNFSLQGAIDSMVRYLNRGDNLEL